MAGSTAGGRAAAAGNKKKYGADFYAKIGAKGGRLGRTGGTYGDSEWAGQIGSIGGKRSKRGYKLVGENPDGLKYIYKMTGTEVIFNHDGTEKEAAQP